MAAATYGPRLLGLSLARLTLPPFWGRFLNFVPVAVFAALVVPALPRGEETPVRLVAALLATLVFWRVRSLWLGLLVGMAAFWALRAL